MDPTPHLEKLFGADDSGYIPPHHIVHLLRLAWSGGLPSDGLRGICWRVLLGLISASDKCLWEKELGDMIASYTAVKDKVLPSLDKVSVDPLSSLSEGTTEHSEWSIYYKNVDLINFIKTDLDRLYITGIPDEYFESPTRRDMLLAILLIWSFDHPVISYRQGMHEMAGYAMYCIEAELASFNALRATGTADKLASDPYNLLKVINEENVEAHTFHLFTRIMNELEPLYDPVSLTPKGVENQPFVVQFSTKVQEHYLRMLDSELCHHLEECHISAQIYGLRWCRLLLGREFTSENSMLFKLWDFMFACCYEAETCSNEALLDIDARPNINSVLASVRIAGDNQHSNRERRNTSSLGTVKHEHPNESSAPAVPNYVCTPLLGALGDLMLAMMLNVRDQMLEGDATTVLGLLMHYPSMTSVTPVLDYADMIKRGVIMGPIERKKVPTKKQPAQHNVPLRLAPSGGNNNNNNNNVSNNNANNSSIMASPWNLNGMKQKLSEKFMQVTAAMNSGINEIVNNIAEATDDDEPTIRSSQSAPPTEGKTRRPSNTKSMFGLSTPGKPGQQSEKGDKTVEKTTKEKRTEPAKTQVSKQPAQDSTVPAIASTSGAAAAVTGADGNSTMSTSEALVSATAPVPESAAVAAAPKRRAQEQPTEPSPLLALPQPAPLSASLIGKATTDFVSTNGSAKSEASCDTALGANSTGVSVSAPFSANRSHSSLSDPLSLLLAPSVDSPAAPSPVPQSSLFDQPSNTSPVLTGKGTGYKNMPADVIQPPSSESRDPFHLQADPANATDLSTLMSPSLSTFFAKEWFPGTSSHRKDKKVRKDKTPRKEANTSIGMDLHELHTRPSPVHDEEAHNDSSEESSGESESESTPIPKTTKAKKSHAFAAVDREALSERVLDLVGSLLNPAYTELLPAVTQGHELEYEKALRQESAKKLLALRDILMGTSTLQDFDARFPPIEASPMPVKNMNKVVPKDAPLGNGAIKKKAEDESKDNETDRWSGWDNATDAPVEGQIGLNLKDELQVELDRELTTATTREATES